jgi:branched-subunit amino acid ABC-type transport system permease component
MIATNIVGILVTTLILGSIYGLVAIGMTLIYGTLRILDMSQGSMVMAGSFIGWGILVVAGWNPILAIIAAFIATFILGALTQLVSVQPLMKRRNAIDFEMVTFITTFAVAMVLTNVALELFGPFQRNVKPVVSGSINVYQGVDLPYQSLTMALVSIALMAGLGVFLSRSRWGMAIRAVAQDLDAARLMGVPVGKLYPATMGLASALAGIAGVFLGGLYFAYPGAGDLPLLEALIVVIFGGLGSLPGTVYAAYAIGLIQATAEVIVGTTWSLPILYGVILLVLIVRPYGLLGRPSEARL